MGRVYRVRGKRALAWSNELAEKQIVSFRQGCMKSAGLDC